MEHGVDDVIWGGGSGGPVDDFFNGGVASPKGKGQIFWGRESDSAM